MKNTFSPSHSRIGVCATLACSGLLLTVSLNLAAPIPTNKPPAYPDWWFEREVIARKSPTDANPVWPASYPDSNDFSAANIGQLKNIAVKAAQELNANLPDGAGSAVNDLVASWGSPPAAGVVRNDFAAVNLGQIKTVVLPFYLRLVAVGYDTRQNLIDHGYPAVTWTSLFPWDPAAQNAQDYDAANLGQLKMVFSFDLDGFTPNEDVDGDGVSNTDELQAGLDPFHRSDGDADGMWDDWEVFHFGNLNHQPGTIEDGGTLTNKEQAELGLNPLINEADLPALRANYTYDLVGRLTGASGVPSATGYTYDFEGNILSAQ